MAAALVAVEGVAGVAAGVGFVVAALAGHPHDRGTAVFLGALLALYGAGVLLLARGVHRCRSWAFTPSMLVQFFALIVAYYQRTTLPAVAAALAVIGLAAATSLLKSRNETRS